MQTPKRFLHAGCGTAGKQRTTAWLASAEWEETRLDIDPEVGPDVVGDIRSLNGIADNAFDAVFSSHNIEHLYPHEVPLALAAFCRVLRADGHLVITCPDLQSVCAHIAEDRLIEPLYTSPAGPVAPLDILYGFRPSLAHGNLYMAHRCGFTGRALIGALTQSGFASALGMRHTDAFALYAVATKAATDEAGLAALLRRHYPA